MNATAKAAAVQAPAAYTLRFGAHAGERLADVPVDYLSQLRKFPALWDSTRRAIDAHLRHLVRHPGEAALSFGKHAGSELDQLDTGYLDWCLGQSWLGGATRWLVGAMLGRRAGRRLICDYRGRVIGRVEHLADVEDRPEPFESKGFSPGEHLYGQPGKKPSVATLRRPKDQAQADAERFGQEHSEPPAAVGLARKDRYRCYLPVFKDGDDEAVSRTFAWDRTLEAVEALASAPTLQDLDDAFARVTRQVALLAQAEDWSEDNALADEAASAYERRREQLVAGEVTFTDSPARVEPTVRVRRGRAVPETARTFDVVRRLRSCRTQDELLDVAAWVARHRGEFSDEAVGELRRWFAKFKAELAG